MTHAIAYPLGAGLSGLTNLQRAFFGYLADYKGGTRDGYERHLQNYFTWCERHQVDPLAADRTIVALYVRHLDDERGLRGSSVSSYMSAVKGFYKWAFQEGYIDRDPAVHVRLPKVEYRSKPPLDHYELKEIRQAGKKLGGRHWALSELLLVHALRISECCGVMIENCQSIEAGTRVMRLRRKGGKGAALPVLPELGLAIDAAAGGRTSGPVLVSIDGYPLHRSSATGLLNTIVRHTRLDRPVNPHLIRASVITDHLDYGGDIREGQRLAGHEDPRTTSRHYDLSKTNLATHPSHIVNARLWT